MIKAIRKEMCGAAPTSLPAELVLCVPQAFSQKMPPFSAFSRALQTIYSVLTPRQLVLLAGC